MSVSIFLVGPRHLIRLVLLELLPCRGGFHGSQRLACDERVEKGKLRGVLISKGRRPTNCTVEELSERRRRSSDPDFGFRLSSRHQRVIVHIDDNWRGHDASLGNCEPHGVVPGAICSHVYVTCNAPTLCSALSENRAVQRMLTGVLQALEMSRV